MAAYGKIRSFNSKTDEWEIYEEQLRFYMVANNISDPTKKRSILLTVCGEQTFKLLRSLVPDGKLDGDDVSYESLVALLRAHYKKKQSVVVHRFHFNTRTRQESESIADYIAALRELAMNCNFGAPERLEEMLRDRLVCGVNHQGIQRRLLSEGDLTYKDALALAQSIECAESDAKKLGSATPRPNDLVHRMQPDHKPPPPPPQNHRSPPTCYRCGGPHLANKCRHKDTQCRYCKKKGHLAKVCRAKSRDSTPTQKQPPKTNFMQNLPAQEESGQHESTSGDEYSLNAVQGKRASPPPFTLSLKINGTPVEMEVDTGAAISILNEPTFDRVKQSSSGQLTLGLKTYTGGDITVLGEATCIVSYNGAPLSVSLPVVTGAGPNLLGRDLITTFGVDLQNLTAVNTIAAGGPLQELLHKHSPVFSEGLGCYNGPPVTLKVKPDAQPKFYKARSVPFALKGKVEEELQDLQARGILSPVKHSPWATPVVPVLKKNGKVRLCGDYKLTINLASPTESYPLPLVDELLAKMSGGKFFSKLDLSNAYLQLPLDPLSKQYVTINTHRGLFQYNRLPFGVASAPAIFQRHMETLLQGLDGVSVYLDDILVSGRSLEEHLTRLAGVLDRLEKSGMHLNQQKCSFLGSKIEYLGHVIDAEGIHPTSDKVKAIQEAPPPANISQLRSFLGLLNYYNRFLPNLATKLTPLYSLLNKCQKWTWGPEQEEAFRCAKEVLQSDSLLVHFDPSKPLVLACDASNYGIGAVLSHILEGGKERPIAYISRTLSTAEKHYSQLEKEALAIIFAVKKFHRYLMGHHFVIESDHQPLKTLFGETSRIPDMAPSRIVRWAIILSAYRYSIRYKSGKKLCNADALSRLPQPTSVTGDCTPADVVAAIDHLSSTAVTAQAVREWTAKDPLLSNVHRYILSGWPTQKLDSAFQPYFHRRDELSVCDGCILWSCRIVIPPPGRKLLLEELHNTHLGTSRMKSLARSYIWWPGMDGDIEDLVKSCAVCQQSRPAPAVAPLHSWEWPSEPWSCLHLDFAGPFLGHMFLVLVDAHSKWLDAHIMQSISSAKTIEKLRSVFATHGLPRKIVTDNRPSFTSTEFRSFLSSNGITHVTTAPYHPSSNGLAERAVQTLKRGLKSTKGDSLEERLAVFLFTYRITPHTTTGVSPAELLMKRRLRSRLDRLFPDLHQRVEKKQLQQASNHNNSKPLRSFKVGDMVYVKDFSTLTWIPGKITKVTGPLSYHVEVDRGRVLRRHVDALRTRYSDSTASPLQDTPYGRDDIYFPTRRNIPTRTPARHVPPRRSTRQRSRPNYYGQ